MEGKEKKIVVGFWLRLLTDIIDAIILGLFGFLLAVPLKSVFFKLGENGLFVGLLITFLYTGILQSNIGQGQSLAKKMLRIQVVNMDGTYLSLPKSFLRYSVIALIFYNTWIWMALTSLFPFLNSIVLQAVFTYFVVFLFLGVTILLVFHPLKRGVHDLLANSMVVRKDMFDRDKVDSLNNKSKAKRALIIWAACSVVLIIFSSYMIQRLGNSMPLLRELSDLQETIGAQTEFENISVNHNWHMHINSEGVESKTTSISVSPFLHKHKFDNQEFKMKEIDKVVDIILESYSKIDECNFINIQVRTGFNIGISSLYTKETLRFDKKGNLLMKRESNKNVSI